MILQTTAGALASFRAKPRLSRATAVAIGVSIAAHVAVGVYVYTARFELRALPQSEAPVTTMPMLDLRPETPPPPPKLSDPPPNIIHPPKDVPAGMTSEETIPFTPPERTTIPELKGPSLPPGPLDAGGGDPPQTPPPAVIRNPQWLSLPSARELSRAYPSRAERLGIGGEAVLSCTVTAQGKLNGCQVLSETPAGEGFGAAALKLSAYFKMTPRTVDGQVVDGAQIRIPLKFNVPE